MIETTRLQLVPFSEDFLNRHYVFWLNDPQIVRYSEQRHVRHTAESCRAFFKAMKDSGHYFYAITTKGASHHIGNIIAYMDYQNRTADISILIGEKGYWHHGLGAEAFEAVMHMLFSTQDVRKITAGTLEVNKGMLKLMRKVGMQEEARRKRQILWEGKEVDVVYYAIFREAKKGDEAAHAI